MLRDGLGILIAPTLPVVIALAYSLATGERSGLWFALFMFGYGITVFGGLPVHISLSNRKIKHAWAYIGSGALVGFLFPFALYLYVYLLSLPELYADRSFFVELLETLAIGSSSGALIAFVFWCIAVRVPQQLD